jgi:hypothetical protein
MATTEIEARDGFRALDHLLARPPTPHRQLGSTDVEAAELRNLAEKVSS